MMEHLAFASTVWAVWVLVGVVYDPVVAPREKNGAPHTLNRYLCMWAYCQMLKVWLWLCRMVATKQMRGKSTGELLAAVFVMGSRKYLRRVTCRVLPW